MNICNANSSRRLAVKEVTSDPLEHLRQLGFIPVQGTQPAAFVYDYFIKDHLGNVRMVLTEEVKQDVYPATTFENVNYNGGTAVAIEKQYYDIDDTKIVPKESAPGITTIYNNNGSPPYNNNPYSNTTAESQRLYKMNASTNKTGLGIVLKVMSGDVINIFGKSFHKVPTGGNYTNPVSPLNVLDILNTFITQPLISPKGITSTQIINQVNFPSSILGLLGNQPPQTETTLKAAINWIIFDDNFKYVSGGFDMTGSSAVVKNHNNTSIPDIIIPKNGYIYVYCSNESQYDVFFDNLQVIHSRGPILEETHYYPFGLTMSGISSSAANMTPNKIKFQEQEFASKEFSDGSGLEMYEFKWRMHDPQTGRFWQIDPLAEKYVYNSTYAFSENKVTGHRELEGLEAFNVNDNDNGTKTVTLHKVDAPFSVQYNGQKLDAFPQQNMNDFYRNNLVVQGNSDATGGVASVKQVNGDGQVVNTFYDNTPGTKDVNLDQASFNFPGQTPLNMQSVPTLGTESNGTLLQSSNVENKNISNSNTGGIPIGGDGTAVLNYSSMGGDPKTFNVTNTTSAGTVLWQASFTGTSGTGSPAVLSLQPGTMLNITVTQPTSNTNTNYNYNVRQLDVTKPVNKTLPVN